jgi:undecaprenyl-diphosphatase
MDTVLLELINTTMNHPVLDIIMIGASTAGFGLMLGSGVALCFYPGQYRKTGLVALISTGGSLGVVLLLQYLILRDRPEMVRHLLPPPNFPSYPSGHATVAFNIAVILGLTMKDWRGRLGIVGGAVLVAYSRVYLGHHYPSDVIAGAVLGASIGAAAYGLFLNKTDPG